MRYTTAVLALAATLLTQSASAGATTSGRLCRAACVPRITQQCGGLTGRALRQCRRPLLRACRATTPDIGCPSTGDLAHALSDRALFFSPHSFVVLCADGSFAETPPQGGRPGAPPTAPPDTTPIVSPGPWIVVVDGDGLAVDLSIGARANRVSVTPTLAGFVVDGTLVADADATAACAPQPPPVSSPPGPGGSNPPAPTGGGTPVAHVPPLPPIPQTPELPPR